MATILTHPAVPLALGLALGTRVIPRRLLEFGIIASILPDVDVAAFRFGIPYGSMFGHRGFTHSILFAVLVGIAFAAFSKVGRERWRTVFLFTTFATLSHGLLDALTNGGLGVGFFVPFSSQRYFFPADWIEVSPIGAGFFSARGVTVLRSELLVVWLPCLAFGLLGFGMRKWMSGGKKMTERSPG
ncbi:MAG: metal-dependent hydrolase [Chthoniobacteraceae bacterium]